jgi:hypothetical protein
MYWIIALNKIFKLSCYHHLLLLAYRMFGNTALKF